MAETIATLVARFEGDATGFAASTREAERHLNSFEGRARRSARGVETSLTGVARSARGLAGTLSLLGAGLTLADLARDASNFERQVNIIRATAGVTAGEMQLLEGTIRRVGLEYRIGANAAAEAAQELQKSGVSVADINAGALESAVTLAKALGGEYADAATIAATTMSVFGLSAADMDDIVQGVTGTVLAGKFELGDYALALQQGGAAAVLAGVPIEDFNALLLLFQKRIGGSGSDMGTLARTFLTRLVPASEEARRRMEDLGLEFFDAQGRFRGLDAVADELRETFGDLSQQTQIEDFNTIFGVDALRGAAALMEEGADGVDRFREAIQNEAQAAEVAEARTSGLAGEVAELSAQWEELGITLQQSAIGDALQGIITLAGSAVSGIRDLVRWMNDLPAAIDMTANAASLTRQIYDREDRLARAQERLSGAREAKERLGGYNPLADWAISQHEERVTELENDLATLRGQLDRVRRAWTVQGPPTRTPFSPSPAAPAAPAAPGGGDGGGGSALSRAAGLSDEDRAMREFEAQQQRFRTLFERYVGDQREMLALAGEMPEFREQIALTRARGTREFLDALAQERGVLDELRALEIGFPDAIAGVERALNQGFDRIARDANAADAELGQMKTTLESTLAVLLALQARARSFEQFDALTRDYETDLERLARGRADDIRAIEELSASGLFDADAIEALRDRINRAYREALRNTDSIDGATIRFTEQVNDTLRDAFVNDDWDWSSISETLARGWRATLWDVFIGEDARAYMDDLARELKTLLEWSLGGKISLTGSLRDIFGFGGAGAEGAGGGGGWGGQALGGIATVAGVWGLSELFGGFFAEGGHLKPGQWGIAGERGPEPIYAGKTGLTVIPAGEGGGHGGFVYAPTIDARGADAEAVARIDAAQRALAEHFEALVIAAVNNGVARRMIG